MKGSDRVLLEVEGDEKTIQDVFKTFPEVTSVDTNINNSGSVNVAVEAKKDLRKDFANALIKKKLGLMEMHLDKVTLEDIFLHLTTKEEEVA